jgi:transcriptional regulator of heat shock response
VKTAEPVSSEFLSENSGLGVSSATVRNALADLEELGYLVQPHTSAGRIPTELGYRYYVAHFLEKKKPETKLVDGLKDVVAEVDAAADRMRRTAKALAELSGDTALVGFAKRDVYYTGLTNLFSKPEFRHAALVTSMSKVLDHLDEVMERVFPTVGDQVAVLIGEENPFGRECGVLIVRAPMGDQWGIMALLGPMRMDYDADYGLLETAKDILKKTA